MQFDKFRLLCWKNFTLQKRHPIAGLFEILFPILIVAIFTWARSNIKQDVVPEIKFESFVPLELSRCHTLSYQPVKNLAVSPGNNTALEKLIQDAFRGDELEIQFFENSATLDSFLRSENDSIVGIEFNDDITNSGKLPNQLHYSIRLLDERFSSWKTDQLYEISIETTARDPFSGPYPSSPPYNPKCFLGIQNKIDRAFIQSISKKPLPDLKMKRFPYPSVVTDAFVVAAAAAFPALFAFCLMFSAKTIIKNITVERETQMKETMKMMGLSSTLHWSAWFFKSWVMLEISIIGMVTLMCIPITVEHEYGGPSTNTAVFYHSNPILVWLFFNIYATLVITFCFLISVLFKKSTTAGSVGQLMFMATYIPHYSLGAKFYSFNYFFKVLYCSLVNSGMGNGVFIMLVEESQGDGLTFSNLFSRSGGFSMGEVMMSMIFGIIVQMLLTVYIEKVFPGDIGIPEPWYFPAIPIYKIIKTKLGYNELINQEAMLQERRISGADFEEEPTNLKAGIRISDLSKVFGNKAAVSKLNLNIYEDQITVLLGHNGAGKTTTMSMLCGMYPPSSGTAFINGKDIRTEIDEARRSLGLCPQHNVLFDELTVKEHIIFFARLKGMNSKRDISDEVRRYVSLLDMKDKIDAQSSTLSGGMKRKLSIGIALCGDSKIVICDEPSSGMDPAGRRALWDLLISEKKGRTILISTHHMDEADILGDRIAIMSEGSLRTSGSSFFLKKKFGTGYKLICERDASSNPNLILQTLQKYAPDAFIESTTQTEANFIISELHLPMFEHIFKDLEDNSKKLGIVTFGCNLSTLEEVFLKLGTESPHEDEEHHEVDGNSQSSTVLYTDMMAGGKVSGTSLMMYQIYAMLLKKIHYHRRNYKNVIWLGCVSAWLVFVMMSAPRLDLFSPPPREIALSSYKDTYTILKSSDSNEVFKSYKSLLKGKDKLLSITQDVETYFFEVAKKSLAETNFQYLVGATIQDKTVTAWFNGQPYHTMPLTINMINRAILKASAGSQYDISVVNKPYSQLTQTNSHGITPQEFDIGGFMLSLVLIFLMAIMWPTVFIGFYVKERDSRAKLLQLISGANRFVFWLTSFLFDFIVFALVFAAIMCGIAAFQRPFISTFEQVGSLYVVLVFFCFTMLPFIYAFSYLFTKHASAENMISLLGLLCLVVYGVWACLKYLTSSMIYWSLADIIYWIGLTIGPFSLADAIRCIGMSQTSGQGISFSFGEFGVGKHLTMMFIGGVVYLSICLLKDFMIFDWLIYKILKRTLPSNLPQLNSNIDSDVKLETEKINNMTKGEISQGNLVLKGLSKFYGSHLAVNQLNLAVGESECFGLLGINGAGKTTTFKMMTGDEFISYGDAYVQGYSMRNQMYKVHQLIGYCPQFDALLMDLTGRETLKIFCLIRGIAKSDINELINKLSLDLGFHQHLDKKIDAFSGGNKRKLSTALALIGDPSLIFLDEPTTGMDPGAKRQLWNIIIKTRNSGRSIVLTSHSIDECEALCTKLAIMVNGEFKCLGSTQHLKNKFSKGFILTVKVGEDDAEKIADIQNRIHGMFPSALMKEKYLDIITFHISENLKWSQIFGMMARMKNEIGIADYALTQTSLEQVFLFFTRSALYQNIAV